MSTYGDSILLTESNAPLGATNKPEWGTPDLPSPYTQDIPLKQQGETVSSQTAIGGRNIDLPFNKPPELDKSQLLVETGLWNYTLGMQDQSAYVNAIDGNTRYSLGQGESSCAEEPHINAEEWSDAKKDGTYNFKTDSSCLDQNIKYVQEDEWNQRTCYLANQSKTNQINNARWLGVWGNEKRGPLPLGPGGETSISLPETTAERRVKGKTDKLEGVPVGVGAETIVNNWCASPSLTEEQRKQQDATTNYDMSWVGYPWKVAEQPSVWTPLQYVDSHGGGIDDNTFLTNSMTVDQPFMYKCYDVLNQKGDRNKNKNYMKFSTQGISGKELKRKGPIKIWFPGASFDYLDPEQVGDIHKTSRNLWHSAWEEAKKQDPTWDMIRESKVSNDQTIPGIYTPKDSEKYKCTQFMGSRETDTNKDANNYANHNYLNAINSGFYNTIQGDDASCRRSMQYYPCPYLGRDLSAPGAKSETEAQNVGLKPLDEYSPKHQWMEGNVASLGDYSFRERKIGGCGESTQVPLPMRKVGGGYMYNWGQTTKFGTYQNAQSRWLNPGGFIRPDNGAAKTSSGALDTYPLLGVYNEGSTKTNDCIGVEGCVEKPQQGNLSENEMVTSNDYTDPQTYFSQQCAYPPALIPQKGEKCISKGCLSNKPWEDSSNSEIRTIEQLNIGALAAQTIEGKKFLQNPGDGASGVSGFFNAQKNPKGDLKILNEYGKEVGISRPSTYKCVKEWGEPEVCTKQPPGGTPGEYYTANCDGICEPPPITVSAGGGETTEDVGDTPWNGMLLDYRDFNWAMAEHCFADVGEADCKYNEGPIYANYSPSDYIESDLDVSIEAGACKSEQPMGGEKTQGREYGICGSLWRKSTNPQTGELGYCPTILTDKGKICRRWATGENNETVVGAGIQTRINANLGGVVETDSKLNVTYQQAFGGRDMADSFMENYATKYPSSALSDCMSANDQNGRFNEIYKVWSQAGKDISTFGDEDIDCWLNVCKNSLEEEVGEWGKGRIFKPSVRRKRNTTGEQRYHGAPSRGSWKPCSPPGCGIVIQTYDQSTIGSQASPININCAADGTACDPETTPTPPECEPYSPPDPGGGGELWAIDCDTGLPVGTADSNKWCDCKNFPANRRVNCEEEGTKYCKLVEYSGPTVSSTPIECPQCCKWNVEGNATWTCYSYEQCDAGDIKTNDCIDGGKSASIGGMTRTNRCTNPITGDKKYYYDQNTMTCKEEMISKIGPEHDIYDTEGKCMDANICYTCSVNGDGNSCIPVIKQAGECPAGSGTKQECEAGVFGDDCRLDAWKCDMGEGYTQCTGATGGEYSSQTECENNTDCGDLPKSYDCDAASKKCVEHPDYKYGQGTYTDLETCIAAGCEKPDEPGPGPGPDEPDDGEKPWYEKIPKEWMIGGGVLVGLIVLVFLMSLFKGKKKD